MDVFDTSGLNIEVSSVCGVLAAMGVLVPGNDIAASALIPLIDVKNKQIKSATKNSKNHSKNGLKSSLPGLDSAVGDVSTKLSSDVVSSEDPIIKEVNRNDMNVIIPLITTIDDNNNDTDKNNDDDNVNNNDNNIDGNNIGSNDNYDENVKNCRVDSLIGSRSTEMPTINQLIVNNDTTKQIEKEEEKENNNGNVSYPINDSCNVMDADGNNNADGDFKCNSYMKNHILIDNSVSTNDVKVGTIEETLNINTCNDYANIVTSNSSMLITNTSSEFPSIIREVNDENDMTQLSEISGIDGSESQNCSISGIKKIESDIDSPIINETITVTEMKIETEVIKTKIKCEKQHEKTEEKKDQKENIGGDCSIDANLGVGFECEKEIEKDAECFDESSDGVLEFLERRWGGLLNNYLREEEIRSKLRIIQENAAAAAAAATALMTTNICPSSSSTSFSSKLSNPSSLTINTDIDHIKEENNNGENYIDPNSDGKKKDSTFYEYNSTFSPSNDVSNSLLFFSTNELEDNFNENLDMTLPPSPVDMSSLIMSLSPSPSLSPSLSNSHIPPLTLPFPLHQSLTHDTNIPSFSCSPLSANPFSSSVACVVAPSSSSPSFSVSASSKVTHPSYPTNGTTHHINSCEMLSTNKLEVEVEEHEKGELTRETINIIVSASKLEINNNNSNNAVDINDNENIDNKDGNDNIDNNNSLGNDDIDKNNNDVDDSHIMISNLNQKILNSNTVANNFENQNQNQNHRLNLQFPKGTCIETSGRKIDLSLFLPKGEMIFNSEFSVENGHIDKNIEIGDYDSALLGSGVNSFFDISNGNSPKSRRENEESYRDVISSFLSDGNCSPIVNQVNINGRNVEEIYDIDKNIHRNTSNFNNDDNVLNINPDINIDDIINVNNTHSSPAVTTIDDNNINNNINNIHNNDINYNINNNIDNNIYNNDHNNDNNNNDSEKTNHSTNDRIDNVPTVHDINVKILNSAIKDNKTNKNSLKRTSNQRLWKINSELFPRKSRLSIFNKNENTDILKTDFMKTDMDNTDLTKGELPVSLVNFVNKGRGINIKNENIDIICQKEQEEELNILPFPSIISENFSPTFKNEIFNIDKSHSLHPLRPSSSFPSSPSSSSSSLIIDSSADLNNVAIVTEIYNVVTVDKVNNDNTDVNMKRDKIFIDINNDKNSDDNKDIDVDKTKNKRNANCQFITQNDEKISINDVINNNDNNNIDNNNNNNHNIKCNIKSDKNKNVKSKEMNEENFKITSNPNIIDSTHNTTHNDINSVSKKSRESSRELKKILSDPEFFFKAWTAACYEEGCALEREEAIIRR